MTRFQAPFVWIVLPVLPVFLGFVLLHLLSDGTITLLSSGIAESALHGDARNLRFFNALIIFAAVGLFQVIGCAAVAVFAATRLSDFPTEARHMAWRIFAGSVTLVILISLAARQDWFSGALNIAYRTTCTGLVEAKVAPHILPGSCTEPGISHFAWLGLMPYMAGILAAAAAAALVSITPKSMSLAAWADVLEQSFRATAFVLVASTVAMMLFYYLPQSVVKDEAAQALVADFAQGMTLFWGIVFSLTLLTVFAPAYWRFGQAVAVAEADDEVKRRVAERGLSAQATRVLTTLSPLLVGSAASAVDLLVGAFGG